MAVGGLATWAARAASWESGQHTAQQQAVPIGVTLRF
jgi:hypothetical protein